MIKVTSTGTCMSGLSPVASSSWCCKWYTGSRGAAGRQGSSEFLIAVAVFSVCVCVPSLHSVCTLIVFFCQ